MTRILGLTTVALALALSLYGLAAAVLGVRRRRPELVRSARFAAYTNFGLLTLANLAMVYALVTHDFSISYVAQVGSRSTPLFYTIISLWSALEGSILFWGWVLAGYTALVVYLNRERPGALVPYALATMLGVGSFFYLLLVGPANPFGRMFPVPPDGPGPNPLLQNHVLMAVHPPLLYLGYVGMTVPFAFAIGALLSGRLDDAWSRTTRRWTVTAWMLLSAAIIAGMWWSYEVLGWGGYWAWDPVENASFMPWLTATAFLHSAMVQERRDMLKAWTLSLIIATFLLTILGTFLTRSGILSSVHAFTQGPIGLFFLAFIATVLVFSLALLAGRSSDLRSAGRLDSVASRETVFLVNNLLFAAFTFTVLLGTLFPLVAEAMRGVKVSVGAPFFNRMTVPLCVTLLFLVGVGPALPWRAAAPGYLRQRFAAPAGALVLAFLGTLAAGVRAPYSVLAFAFAAFALVTNIQEFVVGTRARMRAHGEGPATALRRLVGAQPRRYGGYVVHLGIVVVALGVAASSSFRYEREATLRPGAVLSVRDYRIRFDDLWGREEPQRFVVGANLSLLDGRGMASGRLSPRLNFYNSTGEPVPTPAVRSRPRHDLYATLLAFEEDGSSATFSFFIQPLVAWIWAGGGMVALGALIALWAGRLGQRAAAPGKGDEA
ncbi:MAG: heme lyase CcmF/NrfE family subunit [Gemmatimonadetes bacterium]|nr:heme lyase CcmF/NrfE family subunit [Gemmatimonadota bacterium]